MIRPALLTLLTVLALNRPEAVAALKTDEQVVLYPAVARAVTNGWQVEIQGIVYEPDRQRLLATLLRRALGIDEDKLTALERVTLRERCAYFLVDNERGKQLTLKFGGDDCALGTSAANGHFQGSLYLTPDRIPDARTGLPDTNFTFACQIGTSGQLPRAIELEIQFLHESGVSVVSDIDDTIKISEVLDRDALLQNTFCRPFKPAPGTADLYREWSKDGAQFHYVTASPWQLYLPLSGFVRSNGFPSGTFHMKSFRVKDGSFVGLFKSPERYKPSVIEGLFRRFPQRRFVLVGDSGEKDPEIYGALARRHPRRVDRILIRDVTRQTADSARYRKAFKDVPRGKWQVFKEPSEVGPVIPK